ncbi:hypothetical protein CSO01_15290 [Cellulomonas soli]|uniref:Uncharacterized protein n=1 Tax=Cellulomonas soli TaxID=931535 RepID=A0A512PC82_9CELL|nr:undecaprenyl diphosphate synthase [Cellulomonas soli]GEP68814.1 hypothetical protein CSO01_15290 [Cellulomonas soli]
MPEPDLHPWYRALIDRPARWALGRQLRDLPRPHHLGLIMDGNRRWARAHGSDDPRVGHSAGAEHLETVLGWCDRTGVERVSVYVMSVDNLTKRDGGEVDHLLHLLETTIPGYLSRPGGR